MGTPDSAVDAVARGKYIALTTFRRDGTPVSTPVWFVREGNALVVTTQGTSGKVRRIRANPSVTVGPCDMRGRPTGPAVEGRAVLADKGETARITSAISKRYGLLGRLLTSRGSADDRQGIRITFAEASEG